MDQGFAIIVDIGKTLAKLSLWSRDGRMLDRVTRPNASQVQDGVRRLDAVGIESWLTSALARFSGHPVEYIVPVAHGAGVAAITNGRLAFAPLDYEQELSTEMRAAYEAVRPPYSETGSPNLPSGLNFGAQLFCLERMYPELMAGSTLLPWAQYWAWFLSGEACTEATSMGCHSDLWSPELGKFSSLAVDAGWASQFAPMAAASDVIGTIRPELAKQTGLPACAKILAGLHDSNAALHAARGFPDLESRDATILSTGTWFIAMRLLKEMTNTGPLPESRDCLINVDAYGRPVPSARFMGGREIEQLIEIDTRQVDIKPDQPHLLDAVPHILESGAMVLPTLAPGTGPFPNGRGQWLNRPNDWFARRAGACLYAALVADTSLTLIGSTECLLIEGRFAEAEVFVRALASLRRDTSVYVANAHNDVSFGALRLIDPAMCPKGGLKLVEPLPDDLEAYSNHWARSLGVAA